MTRALLWSRDAAKWPHAAASRFVEASGLRWHVQQMGAGPVVLLIHGTGASTHSWRGLMPRLARRFTVVAIDLPGHAFTGTPPARGLSLPGMADSIGRLVAALELDVALVIGHSAGAAIGAQLVLDGRIAPGLLVAVNGAFMPLAGLAGVVFPPVARLMSLTPLAPQLFARRTWDDAAVERLIGGTGSKLDAEGLALYGALVRDPRHAAGALGMMANWDLRPVARGLAQLKTPLAMIVGANDRAVPPRDAERVLALLPASTPRWLETVRGAGHLLHEEQPAAVDDFVVRALAALPDQGAAPSITS